MSDRPVHAFFDALLALYPEWRELTLREVRGETWHGLKLDVAPPPGSNLAGSLVIEAVADEVTIELDHSHIHMMWPPAPDDPRAPIWSDPLALIDAILREEIVATAGFINGSLRVGSLHDAGQNADLRLSGLQHRRTRSWRGRHDRDVAL